MYVEEEEDINERRLGISDYGVNEPLLDDRENKKMPLEILCKIFVTAIILSAIIVVVKIVSK